MRFWSPRSSEPRVDARSNFSLCSFAATHSKTFAKVEYFGVPFVLQRSMFKHQSILRVRCPLSKYNYTKVLIPDGYVKLEIKRKYLEIEKKRSVSSGKMSATIWFSPILNVTLARSEANSLQTATHCAPSYLHHSYSGHPNSRASSEVVLCTNVAQQQALQLAQNVSPHPPLQQGLLSGERALGICTLAGA